MVEEMGRQRKLCVQGHPEGDEGTQMQNGTARCVGLKYPVLSLQSIVTVYHEKMVHKYQDHVDHSLS